jgi:hypothetical protein
MSGIVKAISQNLWERRGVDRGAALCARAEELLTGEQVELRRRKGRKKRNCLIEASRTEERGF